MNNEDQKTILNALGGKRGLLDSGLPALIFIIVFTVTHKLNGSLIAALIVSAILTIIRLIRKDTLQHALTGLFGVAISAFFARSTGRAQDFYLPGLIINLVYGTVYAVANIIGWPVLGLVLGPILGEGAQWRNDPIRKAAYRRAGWIWVALFSQDALPFLHEAKRVTIVELCENDQIEAARRRVGDVANYLARHRVKAEVRVEVQLRASAADQLVGLASDEGADLLVIGAYGHSRLNEWVFGGMTRDLLTASPICCLMSH